MRPAGAEVLFYPTAIGSEPDDTGLDTHAMAARHAGPCRRKRGADRAANRIGLKDNDGTKQQFYGHSFIDDHRGELVEDFVAKNEGVLVSIPFDLDLIASYRPIGAFSDRRTDLTPRSIV